MEPSIRKSLVLLFVLTYFLAACGVKGRPTPPTNPASVGRGQPTYKEKKKKKTNTPAPVSVGNVEG